MPSLPVSQALDLARQHLAAGRFAQAEAVCRAVIAAAPENADAHDLLALALYSQQQHGPALESLRTAVTLAPDSADYYEHICTVLRATGRMVEVESPARRALSLRPRSFTAAANLAESLDVQGRLAEAEEMYRHALAIDSNSALVLSNWGYVLDRLGRLRDAEMAYRQATTVDPAFSQAWNNLGVLLNRVQRNEEAVAALEQARVLRVNDPMVYCNLGSALFALGRGCEAEAATRRAIELDPTYGKAYVNLGAALYFQGRAAEARDQYRMAHILLPDMPAIHSYALFSELYVPDATAEKLYRVHLEWDQRQGYKFAPLATKHQPDGQLDRPLRLGFVSSDMGDHPVGRLLAPVLDALDRDAFQVLCFSDRTVRDRCSLRLMARASRWHDTCHLLDEQMAQLVRQESVDILFDLAGHGIGSRMSVFALKPAPLQITWLGYEGTTGLKSIDYLLADHFMVPADAEQWYVERVMYLPDGYICFEPPPHAPEVSPPPALQRGFVTFGCFNNLAKVNPTVLNLWARIMQQVPASRLRMKYRGLNDPAIRQRFIDFLGTRGIASDRLSFSGWTSHVESLAEHAEIDIALDTFPFSGSFTTCDAFWMGVPVITWPGDAFASRHTLTHLHQIGHPELVARDADHYVQLAVELAADGQRLVDLRARLRADMIGSPLCNAPRFAENLGRQLRAAWRRYQQGG